MNVSQSSASAALSAFCALLNGGSLSFEAGPMPATPETALTGDTTLCTATYAATAFGAPTFSAGNMVASASFSVGSFNPVAAGSCTFARALKSDGVTVVADLTVGSNWIASQAVVVGQYCLANGATYKCTTAGVSATTQPSGTGNFTDGTAVWQYVGAGQMFDILIGNPMIQMGVGVVPSQTISMPAA